MPVTTRRMMTKVSDGTTSHCSRGATGHARDCGHCGTVGPTASRQRIQFESDGDRHTARHTNRQRTEPPLLEQPVAAPHEERGNATTSKSPSAARKHG